MTLNKFINIDGSFYINDNLLPKYSNACISFIANQKKINKLIIEKKFKKKNLIIYFYLKFLLKRE